MQAERRLDAAEAEVESAPLHVRAGKADGGRVAALGGPLDGGTPRVPEPEQPGGLVECLAHRVVASPAKASVLAWSPCQVEARVAARDDEPEEGQRHRLVWRAVEVHGKQMPLEMVDADQPEVASLGDALRQRETDEQ